MSQLGEEEANYVQVQYFLPVFGGKATNGELFNRGSEAVVSESGIADPIIAANETTQFETLEVKRMETFWIAT